MHSKHLFALTFFLGEIFAANSIRAQGAAFTYQGRLNNNSAPASGSYDLRFAIYDSTNLPGTLIAGPLTNSSTGVTNGLFTVTLNFGANIFTGSNYWLDIGVRTNGSTGAFTSLTPRQQLTPAPYAIFATTASNLSGAIGNSQLANSSVSVLAGPGLSGGGSVALGGSTTLTNTGIFSVTGNADVTASTIGGAVTLSDTATSANTANAMVKRDASGNFSAQNITANSFNGAFSGNGASVTSVNAATLNGLTTTNFWQTTGNTGINPTNGGFIGTADNQPLELRVNNQRALRIEPTASGPNIISGYSGNFVSPGITTATIAGGGHGGATNFVTSGGGTVGGGNNNSVSNFNGVVAGGANNSAAGNASVVGGGSENVAIADHAAVSGGQGNIVQSAGSHATISGGMNNTNSGQFATIAGGMGNTATGNYSFAAGLQAQATNQGAFVWADSQAGTFGSTSNNQFNVRAGGGVRFVTGGNGITVDGQSVISGIVQPSQINDGGASAYQGFQGAVKSVSGDSSLNFSNLFSVTPTNGIPPSLSLTINGTAFGTVVGFSGKEGISQPYSFSIEVLFSGAEVTPGSQMNQQGALTFTRNGRTTTFAGVVTACTVSGATGTGLLYTVRLESPLALLALSTDYKIYLDKTVLDVASQVYLGASGTLPSTNVTASYLAHTSLTQFGETGLNFFSRLLEFEGTFYFFNQSSSPPGLVFGDYTGSYLAGPAYPYNYYGNTASNIPAGTEYIRTFQSAIHQSSLSSTVNASGGSLQTSTGSAGVGNYYEFGNDIGTISYDSTLAVRREQIQTDQRQTITSSGNMPDLRPGYTFTLTDQSGAGLGGSYLVTSVHHAGFVLVTNGVSTFFYGNTFQVIPASLAFRPPLLTPRPQAQPCTATVVGPAGETIYTDEFSRLKVQFDWDRYGKNNEVSSEWIPLATPLASGGGRGTLFIPRIGDEVLVSFIQGDPDQPVITGSIYNAANPVPFTLPVNSAVSAIRSTGLNGDSALVNELEFDDSTGSELLLLAAAKDMLLTAHNNLTANITGTIAMSAQQNLTLIANNNATLTANNNLTLNANQTTINSPVSVNGAVSTSTLRVNGGTSFTNYQAGQAIVGTASTSMTNVTIVFPKAFISVPKVIATASGDPGYNVNDTFVTSVRSISTTSCVLNVLRVDAATGWGQNLRVNWMAWE